MFSAKKSHRHVPQVQVNPTTDVVCDLDALISKSVGFVFQGETHEILPMTTETFMKVTNAIAGLPDLAKKTKAEGSVVRLIDAWEGIFSAACPTITRKHIEGMTTAQIGSLFQLILDTVQGRTHANEKKKTVTLPHQLDRLG